MRIKFSKQAFKSLGKLTEKQKESIRLKLKALLISIKEYGIIPFKELQIKKMRGKWEGFMRMKIGKLRVIFKIKREKDILFIYIIDFRGSSYKP